MRGSTTPGVGVNGRRRPAVTAHHSGTRDEPAATRAAGRNGSGGPGPAGSIRPAAWHRGLTILAILSMFIGTRALWTEAIVRRPTVGLIIAACYAGILGLAVLTATVVTRSALQRVDAGVLLLGIVLVSCWVVMHHVPGDEAILTGQAAHELLHGRQIYGQPWPSIFTRYHVGVTYTMSGGSDLTYAYPPVAVVLTAATHVVTGLSYNLSMIAVTTASLIATCVTLWILLPVPWRSAAVALCLGFGNLRVGAGGGIPAEIALAFMVPVVVGWPTIGAGGRLRRRDIIRAVCLGIACATQQLPWFIAPFLLVGLYFVRRGELSTRSALRVVGTFTGIAALTFAVINAPFAIRNPSAWLAGVLTPLTQQAVPHGQGLIDISLYLTDGSRNIAYYSYAVIALAIALLVLTALFVRRLGPAVTILPWCLFYLAVRSQDGYYINMTPLWLAAIATATPAAFRHAHQPRLRLPTTRFARAGLVALLLAPAAVFGVIAAASPPALRMHVTGVRRDGATQHLQGIAVTVTNETTDALVVHFAISSDQSMSRYWLIEQGPARLAGGQTAAYVLNTAVPAGYAYGPHGYMLLRVVTADPLTLSTTAVPTR